MKEIGLETKYKFDKYNWCDDLYDNTSISMDNVIIDYYFYWVLTYELDEHLK